MHNARLVQVLQRGRQLQEDPGAACQRHGGVTAERVVLWKLPQAPVVQHFHHDPHLLDLLGQAAVRQDVVGRCRVTGEGGVPDVVHHTVHAVDVRDVRVVQRAQHVELHAAEHHLPQLRGQVLQRDGLGRHLRPAPCRVPHRGSEAAAERFVALDEAECIRRALDGLTLVGLPARAEDGASAAAAAVAAVRGHEGCGRLFDCESLVAFRLHLARLQAIGVAVGILWGGRALPACPEAVRDIARAE
mmetsp:Transcript_7359/g.18902  ORF Transcript_7359/g.18902 Transcript_7359/m.18902 type:complete len:245 (-) Transcript_7359:651-1385(-)